MGSIQSWQRTKTGYRSRECKEPRGYVELVVPPRVQALSPVSGTAGKNQPCGCGQKVLTPLVPASSPTEEEQEEEEEAQAREEGMGDTRGRNQQAGVNGLDPGEEVRKEQPGERQAKQGWW